ncbi:hypothetical protein [Ferviditalea candida]|uniref:Uncharacterized protein n=1 Tax=Ferviditalea candida TaxID=3108399 RepID=A0ABU5ZPC3_9BACL|nr:hypothetical protein [Paenibacillaceae bacterium T2]
MSKCQYPNCRHPASVTWALVPVCQEHWKSIYLETVQYYRKAISREQRVVYAEIESLTPWQRR